MKPPRPIVVAGAGGHAKVVIDILRAEGCWTIVGLTAAAPAPCEVLGVPVLGDDEEVLPRLRREGIDTAFVALGENAVRLAVAGRCAAWGFAFANAVCPSAVVSPNARLGVGIAVMPRAVINAGAAIADFAIVNTAASVDHDCVVGEGAHVGPGANLAGWVRVGARTLIGVGAAVAPRVEIGADAVIGAGAAVVRPVPPHAVARGVPARQRRARSASRRALAGESGE
jgi:UDP-perosamine 4-acetyltransferase